jgi:hypothetical protein
MSGIMVRFAVFILAIVLVAGVLSALPATHRSPYASALASLATGQVARAASRCSDRTCDATGTRCVHLNGSGTDCGVGDFCRTRACL